MLYLSTDKLYEEFLDMPLAARNSFAGEVMGRLDRYWNLIASNAGCRILQPNFTEILDNALGNYSGKVTKMYLNGDNQTF